MNEDVKKQIEVAAEAYPSTVRKYYMSGMRDGYRLREKDVEKLVEALEYYEAGFETDSIIQELGGVLHKDIATDALAEWKKGGAE